MKNLYTWVAALLFVALTVSVTACTSASSAGTVTVVDRPDTHAVNANYMGYRAPLRPLNFIKLPVQTCRPRGLGKEISGVAARRPDRTFRGNQRLVGKG